MTSIPAPLYAVKHPAPVHPQQSPEQVDTTAYPLPAPAADPRFTFGLVFDVAKLIEDAGYPPIKGVDVIGLQQALYRFLYAPDAAV